METTLTPTVTPAKGLAIAALVCGIVGTVTGLIPFLFVIAGACGVVALVLGLIALRTQRKAGLKRRGTARAGFILGVAAVALSIAGYVIVNNALTDLQHDLDDIITTTTTNG